MKRLKFLAFLFSLIFIFFGIITINDYGVSWDEPEHFFRGQGYLQYFLKGRNDFSDLSQYDLERARNDRSYHERSYYQHDSYTAEVWFTQDRGHPPVNDILAAFFNKVFYQWTGLLGDFQSYHLFNVVVSGVLVGVVFLFAAQTFGVWAGIFAVISLATYPLFFAESHFNIKDPAQASFFLLSIYLFWKSVNTKKHKFIFFSSLCAGFALGVKFNVLFLPFVIAPWLIFVLSKDKLVREFIFKRETLLLLLAFPLVMFGILFISWPFLWQDIIGNTISVFSYYKELGTEESFSLSPFLNWNFYAAKWILYTTPPIVLVFFFVGLLLSWKKIKENNSVILLWILLFVVSVGRVSFPNTSIYGGVRQIMEYIPAMALLSGVGFSYVAKRFKNITVIIFIIVITVIAIIPISRLHPNQNVYFNSLIGGLSGAVKSGIPYAGNSYGNAYYQIVNWLNQNAQHGARVSLIQGTSLNIPTITLRPDIDFSNSYWSGINREGEYLVEVIFNGNLNLYPYAWGYVETFLEPVYEVKVDNVPIAKVWKNDLVHTKPEFQKTEIMYQGMVNQDVREDTTLIDFGEDVILTRLLINFADDQCVIGETLVYTSIDGEVWQEELETIPVQQVAFNQIEKKVDQVFFFPGRNARFIKFAEQDSECIKNSDFKLYILDQ